MQISQRAGYLATALPPRAGFTGGRTSHRRDNPAQAVFLFVGVIGAAWTRKRPQFAYNPEERSVVLINNPMAEVPVVTPSKTPENFDQIRLAALGGYSAYVPGRRRSRIDICGSASVDGMPGGVPPSTVQLTPALYFAPKVVTRRVSQYGFVAITRLRYYLCLRVCFNLSRCQMFLVRQ